MTALPAGPEFCTRCKKPLTAHTGHGYKDEFLCGECFSSLGAEARAAADAPWQGSAGLCITLGLICLMIGGWHLINPTAPAEASDALSQLGVSSTLADRVVNLQKLLIGQTMTVIGAIFLAAGIRPRHP